MKDKSKKHDHKGTKILKLSIFASVMLAPLFAIGFKCAYATFNKNAYHSYSGVNIYQASVTLKKYKEDNNINIESFTTSGITNYYINYPILTTYNYSISQDIYGNNRYLTYGLNVSNITIKYGQSEYTYNNSFILFSTNRNSYTAGAIKIYENILFEQSNSYIEKTYDYYGNLYINGLLVSATQTIYNSNQNIINSVTFVGYDNYMYFSSIQDNLYNNVIDKYETNLTFADKALDNAFYYAVDQMKDNDLFAWTKNTALYTPINAMTSGLGITTDAISVLLAYWLYITLIYVVFDIVIELFTYLSHLIMGNPIG